MPPKVLESTSPSQLERIIALRFEILRKPWNQPYESSRDELEDKSINAFIENENKNVVACGRLQKNDPHTAQVRYMAVDAAHRGRGLGAAILSHLEERASEWKITRIQLQARENAVDFYQSQGYRIVEKSFLLWGQIQHYLMEKIILEKSTKADSYRL
jgi:predicted GNAT family N-acyltransferase